MTAMFADVAIESSHGCTCIIASVRDDSELYGLLDRFQDLALHLVSINELSADTTGSRADERVGPMRVDAEFGDH